ncbi:MAG: hypothetical protein SFU56_11060 [Capsulimonadales bacterium]|nr:hypothetical protein [Capsulimonadales bacterium]
MANGQKISGADLSFYTHKLSEATIMGRGRAFHHAVHRARHIHFALDGMGVEGVENAVRKGTDGFRLVNMTDSELHYIMTNPASHAKTPFYLGGSPVSIP